MTTWRLTHCGHRLAGVPRVDVDPRLFLARRLGEEPRRNDPALVRQANLDVAHLVGALPPDPADR